MTEFFKVEILGNEYTLKGDLDRAQLERVAALLNERVKEVQDSMPTGNKIHVVILAALNLACDYLQAKEALEKMEKTMEAKGLDWISKLDAVSS